MPVMTSRWPGDPPNSVDIIAYQVPVPGVIPEVQVPCITTMELCCNQVNAVLMSELLMLSQSIFF